MLFWFDLKYDHHYEGREIYPLNWCDGDSVSVVCVSRVRIIQVAVMEI